MDLALFNTTVMTDGNNLKPITNPVVFDKGYVPTADGVLSTEIFGMSVRDRKNRFAYIELNGHFIHPYIYKLLKRMNRNFEHIVSANKTFKISEDGELIPDESGDTGLEWLYKNWAKINFSKNGSMMRNERVDLLKATPKDTIFTKRWLVMPAFYRDVDLQSVVGEQQAPKLPEINDLYTKLIRF